MTSLSTACKTVFGVSFCAPIENEAFRFRTTTDKNSVMSSALQFARPEEGKITLRRSLQARRSIGDSMGVRIAGAAADDPDAILVENTVQGSKTEGRHGRGIQRLGIGSRQGVKFLVVVGGGKGSIFKMNCGSAWTNLDIKWITCIYIICIGQQLRLMRRPFALRFFWSHTHV